MDLKSLILKIKERQGLLSQELKSLQTELEVAYENNALESGVIDRGYYSSFNIVLNRYRQARIIDQWLISEEEYTNEGQLVKIPIVDIVRGFENKRLFVVPMSLLGDLKIDTLFKN